MGRQTDIPLETRILAAEERLRQAMLCSDVVALDELLSPDLIFTSHLGQVIGKEDDLDFHRSGLFRLEELIPSEQRIRVQSSTAVVSVLMHLSGSYSGAPFVSDIRYTRLWSFFPCLQVIAGHASAVSGQ